MKIKKLSQCVNKDETGLTCFELYDCCDCGADNIQCCGCRYCFSCNACEYCLDKVLED
jgi:hypothetical protein